MTYIGENTGTGKGTCYTMSGDMKSFEPDEWHGFSNDGGYSSSTYVDHEPSPGGTFYSGNNAENFDFDMSSCRCFFEITKEPSSTSYDYTVSSTLSGYDELAQKVNEYAAANIERLSGYTMDQLTDDGKLEHTYEYFFFVWPQFLCATYYNGIPNYMFNPEGSYSKRYYLKKAEEPLPEPKPQPTIVFTLTNIPNNPNKIGCYVCYTDNNTITYDERDIIVSILNKASITVGLRYSSNKGYAINQFVSITFYKDRFNTYGTMDALDMGLERGVRWTIELMDLGRDMVQNGSDTIILKISNPSKVEVRG